MNNKMLHITNYDIDFYVQTKEWPAHRREYTLMMERLNDRLADDDRVQAIVFDNDAGVSGITVQLLTKRCTQFRIDAPLDKDYSNCSEVIAKFLEAWSKQPQIESDKEQYSGIWKKTGKKINFNRMWNHYRFSDDECRDLLDDVAIEFEAPNKAGDMTMYRGRLSEQEYRGYRFIGFALDGWAMPKSYMGHVFSNDEYAALKAGKEVYINDLYSNKKNKSFGAFCVYSPTTGVKITRFK